MNKTLTDVITTMVLTDMRDVESVELAYSLLDAEDQAARYLLREVLLPEGIAGNLDYGETARMVLLLALDDVDLDAVRSAIRTALA